MKIRTSFVSVVVSAAALTACGGNVPQVKGTEGSAPTASTENKVEGPSSEDVERYFKSVADNDPSEMQDALRLTAPGSIAELYLKHQLAGENATIDGGGTVTADDFAKKGDAFESCSGTGEDQVCTTWADVQAKGDKIANFTVNGRGLAGRIIAGNEKVYRLGTRGSVQMLSAYKTSGNALNVALKVTSTDKSISMESRTSYRTKAGRQIGAQGVTGPTELRPKSMAYYLVSFEGADLGGDLHLEFFLPKGSYDNVTADIPIR